MTRTFRTYGASDIDKFINDMQKYSIGMDEWLHRMGSVHETKENYPPYNLLKETEIRFRLEFCKSAFLVQFDSHSSLNCAIIESHSSFFGMILKYLIIMQTPYFDLGNPDSSA